MICPKCGYARKKTETVAGDQCPSCGVYYAKVREPEPVFGSKAVFYKEDAKPAGWSILKTTLVTLGIVAFAVFAQPRLDKLLGFAPSASRGGALAAPDGTPVKDLDFSRVRITMYSLTTCGYCTALRHQFEANGVPFTEVFLDTEPARQQEFFAKLEAAGLQGGAVGTPTLEVNGRMLLNNPPMDEILAAAFDGKFRRRAS